MQLASLDQLLDVFQVGFQVIRISDLLERECQDLVAAVADNITKPLVGANAADTFVLTKPVDRELCGELADTFRERPFFVQPFRKGWRRFLR